MKKKENISKEKFNSLENEKKEYSGFEYCENEKCSNEVGEDTTQYGEFVSSYFAWIPLPKQKERANELDKMTKKSKK